MDIKLQFQKNIIIKKIQIIKNYYNAYFYILVLAIWVAFLIMIVCPIVCMIVMLVLGLDLGAYSNINKYQNHGFIVNYLKNTG